MKTVRVMIADPLSEVVAKLEKILKEDARIEVVAHATTAKECLRKAPISKPSVILMDVKFEDMPGARLIRELSRKNLAVAVLIVSQQAVKGNAMLETCLNAGAFDFLHRTGDMSELETIGRQILNRVFVASFSKTKQIPTGDIPPEEDEAPAAGGNGVRAPALDIVLVDSPAEKLREVLALVTAIQAGLKPALIVLVRRPPPFAELLVQKLQEKVKIQLHNCRDGDYIVPGRIFILDSFEHDLLLERNISGEWVQVVRSMVTRDRPTPPPGIDKLLETMSRSYNDKAGVVLFGGDAAAGIEGLKALKARGGTAIIEEAATDLLAAVQQASAGGPLHDQVLSVEQIAGLINAIGHS